jgi:hypothetical protein
MRSLLLFLLMGATAGTTLAQTRGSTSYTIKAAYADSYLFRGKTLEDEGIDFLDLGIGIGQWNYTVHTAGILTLDVNNDIFDPNDLDVLSEEVTHEISYTTIAGRRVITYGYQYFNYEGLIPDTQEIYTRVAHDRPWNPTYGIAFDFDTYKGYYIDGSLTKFYALTRRSQLVFNLRAGLSYNMDEERDDLDQIVEQGFFDDNGLNHASTHLKWLWQPNRWLKAETGADYHYAFDDLLYDDVLIDKDTLVWRTTLTITLP